MLTPGIGLTVSVANACKSYISWGRAVEALKGVSFEVMPGEVATILGSNGSGKSTLLKAIGGLIALDSGRVDLGGLNIDNIPNRQLARWRGLLHQDPLKSLCPNFSADEMYRLYLDRLDQHSEARLKSGLRESGVQPKGKVRELSGGQQQLLALELVLARSPKLLLLDEPTASLDSRHANRILERIEAVGRSGVTVVMVSHNLEHCLRVSQRIAFLHEGLLMHTWVQDEKKRVDMADLRESFFKAAGVSQVSTSGAS